jgi:hypothetical protein
MLTIGDAFRRPFATITLVMVANGRRQGRRGRGDVVRRRGRLKSGPRSASMAAPWLQRSQAQCFEPHLRGGGTTRERRAMS